MVHEKWKRHLSFEELDTRIAMNADMAPLRAIAFESSALESPSKNYGSSIEIRSISVSVAYASVDRQQIEIRQIEIRQEAILRILPKYEFIRFNAGRLLEEMNGEGEGRGGNDHAPASLQYRVFEKVADGEFVVKPALPVRVSDSQVASILQLNAGLNAVKTKLPQSTNNHIRNQAVSRPEPIEQRPLSTQPQIEPQPNTQIAASAIQTTSASPLSDTSIAKTGFNSVSGIVGPKTESAKPTKDGMLSFSMDTCGVQAKSTLSGSETPKVIRVRSQHQNEVLLRQMHRAQVDSLIDELAVNAKGLPVPKGMIEIRDHAYNSQIQGVVSKAGTNPFEILQLFIGSSNMVQSKNALESQATNTVGISSDSPESTELATKEDILVTLGIGAVLAIAIRESKIRHQKAPFFATFRHPVAQAT